MSGSGIARQDDCCKGCGKPLVPNPGEKPSHFKRRTYCDKGCYLGDPDKPGGRPLNWTSHRRVAAKPVAAPDLCIVCGRASSRKGLSTCSKSCAAKLGASRVKRSPEHGQAIRQKSWSIVRNHALAKKLAKLPRKDFETVEQACARGVSITRCEPAYAYPSDHMPNGSPVRPAMGKGRRAS